MPALMIPQAGDPDLGLVRAVAGGQPVAIAPGVLAAELFVDTNSEPFFLAAKFWPYLQEIRTQMPAFLLQMERLLERSAAGRQKLEVMQASAKKRMAARQAPPLPDIQRPD